MSEPALELNLLGTRFHVEVPDASWGSFLRDLWGEFEVTAAVDPLPVRIFERDDRTWLQLLEEQALPFTDPWTLAEVVRYWLVEHAVRRAQGVLPFHAAALTRGERGVLFAGPSGAGKTTLSLVLANAGWAIAGDDIAPVDLETGLIHPFPKPLNIRAEEEWAALGRPPWRTTWPDPVTRTGPLLVPAGLFRRQRTAFAATDLVFIAYVPGASPEWERLPGGRAAAMSIEYVRGLGKPAVTAVARLCRGVTAGRMRYGSSAEALALVENHLTNGQK